MSELDQTDQTPQESQVALLDDLNWVWHSDLKMKDFMGSMPFIGGIAHGIRRSVKTYVPDAKVGDKIQGYEVCVINRQSGYKTIVAFPRIEPITLPHE